MITGDLVRRRIANFWGYGSFEAPAWFVGMEEGLGAETELEECFRAADGKTTIDMRRDMARVPQHMRWFQPPAPPLQQNWKYSIALRLVLKIGKSPSPEEIRAYQRDVLGDVDFKDSCAVELMPSRREARVTPIGDIRALWDAENNTSKSTSRSGFGSYGAWS